MRKTAIEPTLHFLNRGLRLVHLHDRHTGAGIFGVVVRAGSVDENPEEYGLAHLVEHTIFKGTHRRSSWHIINRMESVGGELNAYTTKETTVVYSIFPARATSRAVELVADLTINSRFPEKELEKERDVVIDEINSYLDTPSEAVFDDFEDLIFKGNALGHNILGSPESVAKLKGGDCRRFLDKYYRGPNMVAFYCGPISAERVGNAIERYFAELADNEVQDREPINFSNSHFYTEKTLPVHQSNVVMGSLLPIDDMRQRYAAALLANIVGGPGMNSLLNVELRERRGLVYSVEAINTYLADRSLSTVYFACDEEDRSECLRLCKSVFTGIADGSALNTRMLAKARKQYLGQMAIALENRENRILAAARSTLFHGRPRTNQEIIADIEALTVSDISAQAARMADASVLAFIPE